MTISYEQYAKDVFDTAIEGGINYWADIYEVSNDEGRGWYAKLTVSDSYEAGSLISQVVAVLKEAAETDDYEKFLNMYDVEWTDIIVQYGLFGELVFG